MIALPPKRQAVPSILSRHFVRERREKQHAEQVERDRQELEFELRRQELARQAEQEREERERQKKAKEEEDRKRAQEEAKNAHKKNHRSTFRDEYDDFGYYGSEEFFEEEREPTGDLVTCVICGMRRDRADIIVKGGWEVCVDHKVYIKPSKFASRCNRCLGHIKEGQVILLSPIRPRHWFAVHVLNECGNNPTVKRTVDSTGPYAKLHLTNDAPIEVIRAAYKALALLHHPDRGGDNARMAEINAALDLILESS